MKLLLKIWGKILYPFRAPTVFNIHKKLLHNKHIWIKSSHPQFVKTSPYYYEEFEKVEGNICNIFEFLNLAASHLASDKKNFL